MFAVPFFYPVFVLFVFARFGAILGIFPLPSIGNVKASVKGSQLRVCPECLRNFFYPDF